HAKRICRILRSESWKQVEKCRNVLRIKCHASGVGERTGERDYKRHLKTAAQYTDFFWEQTRPKLMKKTSSRVGGQEEVTGLGDVTLPPKVKECLEHGPKYSQEQRMRPVTQLSLEKATQLTLSAACRKSPDVKGPYAQTRR
ncbi:hypothetical protein HPB47_012653, partial [Ixodes persulcatus]